VKNNDPIPAVIIGKESVTDQTFPDYVTTISADIGAKIGDKILENFNSSPHVFMNDGNVGSHSAQATVRVITDSPTSSLYLKHQLNKTNGNYNTVDPDVVVYYTPQLDFVPQNLKKNYWFQRIRIF